jgi:hypothetical protein
MKAGWNESVLAAQAHGASGSTSEQRCAAAVAYCTEGPCRLIMRIRRKGGNFDLRGPFKILIHVIETLHFTFPISGRMVIPASAPPSLDGGRHPKTEAILDAREKDNG